MVRIENTEMNMKKPNGNKSLIINQVSKGFQSRNIRIFSNLCLEEEGHLPGKVIIQNIKDRIIMPNCVWI